MSLDVTEDEVKKHIRSILTSAPVVLNVKSVQRDYSSLLGFSIPYSKFKYNSLEQFLKNIPDTCTVKGSGPFAEVHIVPNEKSKHINELVTKQKINVKNDRNKRPQGTRRRYQQNRPKLQQSGPKSNSNGHNNEWNYSFTPNNSSSSLTSYESMPHPRPLPDTLFNDKLPPLTNNLSVSQLNTPPQSSNSPVQHAGYKCEQKKIGAFRVKNNVENMIKNLNESLAATALFTNNAEDSKSNMQINSLNNFNQKTLNRTLNLGHKISESNEAAVNGCSSVFFAADECEEDSSIVPMKVQTNLKELISRFPDGIWSSELPVNYRKLFNRELRFMNYGYTSLIEMCLSLSHIFHYVRPGSDDFKLYDKSKPLPQNVEKIFTIASYNIKNSKKAHKEALPDLDWSDFKQQIPDDVFPYGQEIPRQLIPETLKVEQVLDVVVVEVYDPSKFWVYLGNIDNSPLDVMMDEMQTFYNDRANTKAYAVPSGALKTGLYCVQVFSNEYHRARIVKLLPDNFVRVFYIDYGTVSKVPTKGICFLIKKFSNVPAQAIRCRLANLMPCEKGHPWPLTATHRLRELVNRRETKIKISFIDSVEEYVYVFLADVTDPQNVQYINEVLVKEGHALFENQAQKQPFVRPNFKCLVQKIHLFPTFMELEYGLVPDSSEMELLVNMRVPLQFCIPQYFAPQDEVFSDLDNNANSMESSFIETVKNHRKFVNTFNSPCNENQTFNFAIFGELKNEIMAFCQKTKTFMAPEKHTEINNEECSLTSRDSLKLGEKNKELSEQIIKRLEKCCLVYENTTNDDQDQVDISAMTKLKSNGKDFCSFENKPNRLLCYTNEQVGKNLNIDYEINIFDNPEAFEDDSDSLTSGSPPLSPQDYFKSLEDKITKLEFDDRGEHCDLHMSKNPFKRTEMWLDEKSKIHAGLNQSPSSTNPFRTELEEEIDADFARTLMRDESLRSVSLKSILNDDFKEVELQTFSDSDSSGYKEIIPFHKQTQTKDISQEMPSAAATIDCNLLQRSSCIQTALTVHNAELFTPVYYQPIYRQPCPAWSNGMAFPPISSYSQWSNVTNLSRSDLNNTSKLKPPPGFNFQLYDQGPSLPYTYPQAMKHVYPLQLPVPPPLCARYQMPVNEASLTQYGPSIISSNNF
ncbi:tudor domain-containing protein 5 [Euwallacea fornicatus]|uniref:tudor domain-containing protein 5 n=1 Tax=Euwallacea fornicatus TaxID=995702 RepID=UPI0033903167